MSTEDLREAAQAVLDRWDSPQWAWTKHGPTADVMHRLRRALAAEPAKTSAAQSMEADDRDRVIRNLNEHIQAQQRELDWFKNRTSVMNEHQAGEVWYWQGDGGDRLESLVNSLPVVIRADQLRGLLAAAKAERRPLTGAASDVLAERRRQVEVEGWTPQHDDAEHLPGELAMAASCYATADENEAPPAVWPWSWSWWKPKDRRRNLVRAGALILAELERLDRAHETGQEGGAA